MTDATVITIVGALVGLVQGVSTAWLNHSIKRNACGNAKCVEMIRSLEKHPPKIDAQHRNDSGPYDPIPPLERDPLGTWAKYGAP